MGHIAHLIVHSCRSVVIFTYETPVGYCKTKSLYVPKFDNTQNKRNLYLDIISLILDALINKCYYSRPQCVKYTIGKRTLNNYNVKKVNVTLILGY